MYTLPIFTPSQTLTHTELNNAVNFVNSQTQLLGRLVGFGVSCGLEGSVEGSTLFLEPGRAIDQHGTPLELLSPEGPDAPLKLPIDDLPGVEFDFLDPETGGISVVLSRTSVDLAAPECPEDGCDTHATQRTYSYTLSVAKGRLPTSERRVALTSHLESLLELDPIRVSKDGSSTPGAVKARDVIASILHDVPVSALARQVPAGLSFASGTPALERGRAAQLLQRIVLELIVYLRCALATERECFRETATPGVVLGWLEQEGDRWIWHCRYRHDWQMPIRQFADSQLSPACVDPCAVSLGNLERTLLSWLPDAPQRPRDWWKDLIGVGVAWPGLDLTPVTAHFDYQYMGELTLLHENYLGVREVLALEAELGDFELENYIGQELGEAQLILGERVDPVVNPVVTMTVAEARKMQGFAMTGAARPGETIVLATEASEAGEQIGLVGVIRPEAQGAEASANIAMLEGQMAEVSESIEATTDRISDVETQVGSFDAAKTRIVALEGQVAQVTDRLWQTAVGSGNFIAPGNFETPAASVVVDAPPPARAAIAETMSAMSTVLRRLDADEREMNAIDDMIGEFNNRFGPL